MIWDHRRSEWQTEAEPVTGPPFVWRKLQRIVIHWNGGALRWPYDTAQVLRNMQHTYLTDPARGYSLGYNDAVDGAGESWEVRGEDIKCAANREVNESSYAILVLVYSPKPDTWSPANDAQIAAVRERVAAIRERAGWDVPIVPHFAVGSTACCGPAMGEQIAAGVFEPVEHEAPTQPDPIDPTPPTGDDDMAMKLLQPTDCDAQFLGMADRNGVCLEVVWADSERAQAHLAAGAEIDNGLSLGGLRNCVLLGPLPEGDTRHDWDGSEFFRVVT